MKNFIIKLTLTFILPLILLLCALEWALRAIPNDYAFKDEMLSAKSAEVELLSFGSSHGHYGIRSDCFSLSAFNMAMPSQSIKYDHFLFCKYIDKCPSLLYVILPVSYFSLVNELEDGPGWAHAKGYSIYMGYKGNEYNPIFNLELINKEKYIWLLKNVGKPLTFVTCDSLGWGCKREWGNQKPDCTSLALNTAQHHGRSIGFSMEANIGRLVDIIKTCAERDIKVILLTTPTHESYYSLLDSAHLALTTQACERLDAEFSNTTYLNLLKDTSFVDADFYDPDHLNTTGATKLTKKLNEYIGE